MTKETSTYQVVAVHSQSNRPGTPLDMEGNPAEQAFAGRALSLPALALIALPAYIEKVYANYCRETLRLLVPPILVPTMQYGSLSESLMADREAMSRLEEVVKQRGLPIVLSVFDPTEKEQRLSTFLRKKGINHIPEVDFSVAMRLGNKAGFRQFCASNGIPQLPGVVAETVGEVYEFVMEQKRKGQAVVVKHVNGTAGEGMAIIGLDESVTREHEEAWNRWIGDSGAVVAEVFSTGGGEHALHVHIDSITKKARLTGAYDQLVTRNDGGFAHYGCRYPIKNVAVRDQLTELAGTRVIPALSAVGYTGPACLDVLSGPTHVMELNARAGANFYIHRMVERVAQSIYGMPNTSNVAFMFLAGLRHDARSFSGLLAARPDIALPQRNGMLLFTNPLRHAYGSVDITAMSHLGAGEAERILWNGLVTLWGEVEARAIMDKIHTRPIH